MELDNVKFVFLPANTTAGTQPLDTGIIKNFKVFYHKYLVDHLISESMDQDVIITTKGINIKMMVKWIATAWNDITPGTIQNYFSQCGVGPLYGCDFPSNEYVVAEE